MSTYEVTQCDACQLVVRGFPKGWEIDHASGEVWCPTCASKDAEKRSRERALGEGT